jgi:hypothetical protein
MIGSRQWVIAMLFAAAALFALLVVLPAQAQTPVDLSSTSSLCGGQACFNAAGIYNDGFVYFGENFMDGGTECTPTPPFTTCPAAYGAQQLFGASYNASATTPPTLTLNSVPFVFGLVNSSANLNGATACAGGGGEPACLSNVVNLTTSGATITLPAAQQSLYSTLIMLGTSVNGGHLANFAVTYTDGTTSPFPTQTMSDWCGFEGNPNESIAVGGFQRMVANGTTIAPGCNLYAYSYSLDTSKELQSISLAAGDTSGDTFILAITLKPPSYTIEGGTANPASISPGSSSTATVTVAPQPGYQGTVALSCSISPTIIGQPPSAATAPTCSLNPTSVTIVTGQPNPTTTLTFQAASAASSSMSLRERRIFYALWLPIPGIGFVLLGLGGGSRRSGRLLNFLLLVSLLATIVVIPGCVSTVHLGNVGTPPGQYTITITGLDTNNLTQASNGTGNTVVVTVTQ